MDAFHWLLFLHLVGVTIWIGGALVGMMIGTRIRATGDGDALGKFCAAFAQIAGPMFGGSAILVVLTGAGMVGMEGGPEFSDLWVIIALVGWLVSMVLGATVVGGTWNRVGKELNEGATIEGTTALLSRAVTLTWVDLAIRFGLVLLMVWRPT
jgi:uncharacterized membrane protein